MGPECILNFKNRKLAFYLAVKSKQGLIMRPALLMDNVIEHISHWLSTQGPITALIRHKTLYAVQHLPVKRCYINIVFKTLRAHTHYPKNTGSEPSRCPCDQH
jgi:hypothetical protein